MHGAEAVVGVNVIYSHMTYSQIDEILAPLVFFPHKIPSPGLDLGLAARVCWCVGAKRSSSFIPRPGFLA